MSGEAYPSTVEVVIDGTHAERMRAQRLMRGALLALALMACSSPPQESAGAGAARARGH